MKFLQTGCNPYNPRKCSAILLSGCIHQYLSKAIISLPTQAEIVDLFKQTLIGGFSCVNKWLLFDSKILLPKSLYGQRKENPKLIYKIKNDMKNIFRDKRVITKLLKIEENNQYGNAMTKPLPTGSIKKRKKFLPWKNLTLLYRVRLGIFSW